MLEVAHFGHMSTTSIEFEPSDEILLMTSWAEIIRNFQYTSALRRPGVANLLISSDLQSCWLEKPLKTQ